MGEPPAQLDGADVLCWVTSDRGGFYQLAGFDPPITVISMAVARYADGGPFYLFKCDTDWQVVQDWDCGSVAEARELAASHAGGEPLVWLAKAETTVRPREGVGVKAVVVVPILGSGNVWKVAEPSDPPAGVQEREVVLEIQGDATNGYHLVMSPAGCFTADTWHESVEAAKTAATEVFGVVPDEWT